MAFFQSGELFNFFIQQGIDMGLIAGIASLQIDLRLAYNVGENVLSRGNLALRDGRGIGNVQTAKSSALHHFVHGQALHIFPVSV